MRERSELLAHTQNTICQYNPSAFEKSIEADLALIDHYDRLRTVPGIGKILSLVILYEIHDIRRFPTVTGTLGKNIGNAHLKWAFSEAAVLSLRQNPKAQAWLKRTASKHGKPKALSILAHKLGRTVYYLLLRDEAFDMQRFLAA